MIICKKCGSSNRYKVNRTNKQSGAKYTTTICGDCRCSYQRKSNLSLNWQQANRERIREYQRNYYKGKYKGRNGIYSKRISQRTLPNENKKTIAEFYSNCPIGYEVDHIIPLNGKNVSGLHTITNLQYLKASDNRRKSNKF